MAFEDHLGAESVEGGEPTPPPVENTEPSTPPATPTGKEDLTDNQSPEDKEKGKSTVSTVPYSRFREAIIERNNLRKKVAAFEGKGEGSPELKPSPKAPIKDTSDYGKYFEDREAFTFKQEYGDIPTLYNDFRTAILGDILHFVGKQKEEKQTEYSKREQILTSELDDVESEVMELYPQDGAKVMEDFYDWLINLRQEKKLSLGIKEGFEVFKHDRDKFGSTNKPAPVNKQEKEREIANSKISKAGNAVSTETPPEGYEPDKHRNKTLFDLGSEFLNRNRR